MSKEAQLAGITPYVLRLAAYYASLGCDTYYPKGHTFDRVVVRIALAWTPSPQITSSAQVVIVEFFRQDHRMRWVEFAMTPAGFGGDPIVAAVPPLLVREARPEVDPTTNKGEGSSDDPTKA